MENKYYTLPAINEDFIKRKKYFLLFESGLLDKDNFTSRIFFDPVDVLKIHRYGQVDNAFTKIEKYSKKYYLAGYFSYELGYHFENNSFKIKPVSGFPVIYLCVFDRAVCFNHHNNKFNFSAPGLFLERGQGRDFRINNLRLKFRKKEYARKIMRIKEYISKGDTYQVNFTGKYHFNFSGSAFSLYQDLKHRQNVSFAAFCKFNDQYVISLSPELFFKRSGYSIYSRPMKGTLSRGKDAYEDKNRIAVLKNSQKNLAENLMIVDLIRNDLGRICRPGSVRVASLFDIEKYNTLFQMTSTVSGLLRKNITYFDIFKNIFPGGSVTGAPKIRTMQIIGELESGPRDIYCGALGLIAPKNKAVFNLPIRTIVLRKYQGEMGVGSGIVIDSDPDAEFKECVLKAKFLAERYKRFELIETMLWDGRYRFLTDHLRRLNNSAAYFGFSFNSSSIASELKKLEAKLKKGLKYKIRLLLDKEGNLRMEYSEIYLDTQEEKKRIIVSQHENDPQNIFLYHKTTNRSLYEREYKYYSNKGYFDVIYLNKREEVCEGSIANIIIWRNNQYYTPVVSSGLLPGVFRNYLIKNRKVKEKTIFLADLLKADKIFLCNSVRGLTEVRF